jgi:SAM-dependent methyltransferase
MPGGACGICGNTAGNTVHRARESMFGLPDTFEYVECGACGCLQRAGTIDDTARYYPPEYYSFAPPALAIRGPAARFLKRRRTERFLGRGGAIGRLLERFFGPAPLPAWLGFSGVTTASSILDVGCGAGHLLLTLLNEGFTRLRGVDPYVSCDMHLPGGLIIYRRNLRDLAEVFDLIMFHHSFEHVEDPLSMLACAAERLAQDGRVLIRMPAVPCYAWQHYGTDWVQLDAPRHAFVHSKESLRRLADRCGLAIERVEYDSTAFQFWGSEQYRRGIPLRSPRSFGENPAASPFTAEAIRAFEARAAALNARGEGDQACFFLVRSRDARPADPAARNGSRSGADL